MIDLSLFSMILSGLPALLMSAAVVAAMGDPSPPSCWTWWHRLSGAALLAAFCHLLLILAAGDLSRASLWPGLSPSLPGAWLSLLVQVLGSVIGAFSMRYLEGEPKPIRFVRGLAGVLASVQWLVLADHWLILIAAWSATGMFLETLLCFYADRPFALLAAHKKRLADRVADGLLLLAAVLAGWSVGQGSLSGLRTHLAAEPSSLLLEVSAVCLVLAVILRTALLPVHGWLIQVMEAPTPVSALLHAGVVNLGGFVLIRLSPLLEASPLAKGLLVAVGLISAALAGLVMLTRVSIKVRLAWSTVAQMGFMLMECGLGLYSLALLHLIGHSIYKAHAFLRSSSIVRDNKEAAFRGPMRPNTLSLVVAPLAAVAGLLGLESWFNPLLSTGLGAAPWPWWWNGMLALAWAPLLWLPVMKPDGGQNPLAQGLSGALLLGGLTVLANLAHTLPLGVHDVPAGDDTAGLWVFSSWMVMYVILATLAYRPQGLESFHRWSYAGFYLDEIYTRLALQVSARGWLSTAGPRPRNTQQRSP